MSGRETTNPFRAWYAELGFVTMLVLYSLILIGVGLTFEWFDLGNVVFDWPSIVNDYREISRLYTNFFVADSKINFTFCVFVYVYYQACNCYERNPFNTGAGGRSADFLWMMLICMTILLVAAAYFDMRVMADPLLTCILYVWSCKEPDIDVSVFGFKYKNKYQPLVFMLFRVLLGQKIFGHVLGVAVGHLYYFLSAVLPAKHGYHLIKTPKFCVYLVNFSIGGGAPVLGRGQAVPARALDQAAAQAAARAAAAGAAVERAAGRAASATGVRNRLDDTNRE
jgi:Derlin-2/3